MSFIHRKFRRFFQPWPKQNHPVTWLCSRTVYIGHRTIRSLPYRSLRLSTKRFHLAWWMDSSWIFHSAMANNNHGLPFLHCSGCVHNVIFSFRCRFHILILFDPVPQSGTSTGEVPELLQNDQLYSKGTQHSPTLSRISGAQRPHNGVFRSISYYCKRNVHGNQHILLFRTDKVQQRSFVDSCTYTCWAVVYICLAHVSGIRSNSFCERKKIYSVMERWKVVGITWEQNHATVCKVL